MGVEHCDGYVGGSNLAKAVFFLEQLSAMAFVALNPNFSARVRKGPRTCPLRMSSGGTGENSAPSEPSEPVPRISNDSAVPGRKLVRNLPVTNDPIYAQTVAGDMGKAPEVGAGMGPRRGVKDKKVTRAAAIQKSQSFADAWAEQNQGRIDVWIIIGAMTLLTPLVILVWGVLSGAIPTGGLFDQ